MSQLDADLKEIGKVQRSIAHDTDRMVERMIREGRISRPSWWISQRGRLGLFLATLGLCGLAAAAYQMWLSRMPTATTTPNSAQVATALTAATISIFAYYQWNDSRRELSLDKFYDRARLVNERYYEWEHARGLVAHFWAASTDESGFQKSMYVYLELDNLEYIILRYQLGFVSRPLLRRAVRTFTSRCQSPEFSALAVELVKGAGYIQRTVEVVSVLAVVNSGSEETQCPQSD